MSCCIPGQVQILLEEHTNGHHHHLSSQIVERLELVQQTSAHVSKLALVPVHHDDEAYFNDLSFLVKTPWRNFKPHRQIVPSKRWEIPIYHLAKNGNYLQASIIFLALKNHYAMCF